MKSLIVASMFGLAAGHYGTEIQQSPSVDTVAAVATSSAPTTRLQLAGSEYRSESANQAIAIDIDSAANHIDTALGQAPNVATAMAHSINTHGPVKALLYEDPEVKAATDSFANSLGRGLRSLADAITRDMTEGAKQLHPNQS